MKRRLLILTLFLCSMIVAGCTTVSRQQTDRCRVRGETYCLSTNNALNLTVTVTLGPDYNYYEVFDVSESPTRTFLGSILESQHSEIDMQETPTLELTKRILDGEMVLMGALTQNNSTRIFITRKHEYVGNTTLNNLVFTVAPEANGLKIEHLHLCSVFDASQKC